MKTSSQILCAAACLLVLLGVLHLDGVQSYTGSEGDSDKFNQKEIDYALGTRTRKGKEGDAQAGRRARKAECFCKDPDCPCHGGIYIGGR